jgi:hypothetical protein
VGAKLLDAFWLTTAFPNDLHTLNISSFSFAPVLSWFTSPELLEVIGKLRCFEMDFTKEFNYIKYSQQKQNEVELLKIICALPKNAYLKAFQKVDCGRFNHPHSEENEADTIGAIRFWLMMSEKSGRTIKVCLLFGNYRDTVISTENGLKAMKSRPSYIDLVVIRERNRTIVKYKQATIILSICMAIDYDNGQKAVNIW